MWTLNVNDPNFGLHVVKFTGTVASAKTGPMMVNGTLLYQYLGCYTDNIYLRVELIEYVNPNTSTNGLCQTQAHAAGYVFGGTEYIQQCFAGDYIPDPSLLVADNLCNCQ